MNVYKTKTINVGDKTYEFEYPFNLRPRTPSMNCKIKDVIEGAECEIINTDKLLETPEDLKTLRIWSVAEKNHYYNFVLPEKIEN